MNLHRSVIAVRDPTHTFHCNRFNSNTEKGESLEIQHLMFAEEDEHSLTILSMIMTMEQPLANLCRSQRFATCVVVVGMNDDWDLEH